MVAEYIPGIRELQAWMGQFIQATGDEFLQLGSTLEECHRLTQRVLAVVRNVLSLADDSDDRSPLFGARRALATAIEDLSTRVEQYTRASNNICEAHRQLQCLEPLQAALIDSVRPFRYIRLNYQIESAWLDADSQRGMAALGQEMATLEARSSAAYATQSIRLKEAKELLAPMVNVVSEKVRALATAKSKTESLLSEIGTVPPEIARLTGHLLQNMQSIASNTVDLIVSLQTDDAVRQSLEHVREMLEEIVLRIEQLDTLCGQDPEPIRWFIHEACAIQVRQVQEIARRIEESGQKIRGSLEKTVSQTADLLNEACLVTSSAAENGGQSATTVHLSSATDTLGACFSDAVKIDPAVFTKVNAAVELACTISTISQDMKLVSINAQICAAKVSQMETIAVLGSHARSMSDANLTVTLQVEHGLGSLSGVMADFSSIITGISETREQVQRKIESLSLTFADELSNVQKNIVLELQGISVQCGELRLSTIALLEGISFISSAEQGLGKLSTVLEQLILQTALSRDHSSQESVEWLSQFKRRYTLDVERVLHEGENLQSVAEPLVWTIEQSGLGFGDNVELF
jgi:hypothetical protein